MSSRRPTAALGLAVLLGGLALPLLGLVPADGPVPSCCRGRCCCTGEATDEGDGRACLRPRCGCGQPDPVVIAAPLQVEAVVPAAGALVLASPSAAGWTTGASRAIARTKAPPVPPPKRSLLA